MVGSGAREHALCAALADDGSVGIIHCAPGNPGIGALARLYDVSPTDPEAISELAVHLSVDLVVVGPEAPLVAGVCDAVRARGIPCFGPSREAAQLEGSKAFAKQVMAAADVPTGRSYLCTSPAEVEEAIDAFGPPYVVKEDGLAAGKGVVVTPDRAVALAHAAACQRVVVEEYLDGPEASLFAVTDGTTVIPLEPAQDFKRVGDGDTGPNTGGMGAYSPLPWAPPDLVDNVLEHILQPTIDELHRRGTPFVGLLYAGLALTSHGVRVIEFNARFGDPETQVVLARLRSPLGALLHAAATGNLAAHPPLRWASESAVTVVLAAEHYPSTPAVGDVITGADGPDVFQAGTAYDSEGHLVSAGGRVLSVMGLGATLGDARAAAYDRIETIDLRGGHYRHDIAAAAAAVDPGAASLA